MRTKKTKAKIIFSEELRKFICKAIGYKEVTISELSRQIKKDKNNLGRYLSVMKEDEEIDEEEVIKKGRGKCKVVRLRKKGYGLIGLTPLTNTERIKKENELKNKSEEFDEEDDIDYEVRYG